MQISHNPPQITNESLLHKVFHRHAATAETHSASVRDEVQLSQDTTPCQPSLDLKELAQRNPDVRGDMRQAIVVSGTDGNDTIKVTQDRSSKALHVTVNGQETVYRKSEVPHLLFDAGAGDDNIIVDKSVTQRLYITGGAGNDTIQGGNGGNTIVDSYGYNTIHGGKGEDKIFARGLDNAMGSKDAHMPEGWDPQITGNVIYGGDGNDYIEGGFGNDKIDGGKGNDVIYGLNGDDVIEAGDGRDYVDGGKGNDTISASSGNNMIFGGEGNDTIKGGRGNDVIVTGTGSNTVVDKYGTNKIVYNHGSLVQAGKNGTLTELDPMSVPDNLGSQRLEDQKGTTEHDLALDSAFDERVASDYQAIAATIPGQVMLTELGKAGQQLTTVETLGGNSCSFSPGCYQKQDGTPGTPSASNVNYNTGRTDLKVSDWGERPPLVGLYHEMAHSYNAATGTLDPQRYEYDGTPDPMYGTKGCEFQAVGIDNGVVKQNPQGISENAMRDFLNLPTRPEY